MRWAVVLCGLVACGRLDFQPLARTMDAGADATDASVDGPIAICGNGVIDVFAGETCDDGNTVGNDGCSATCQTNENCGNGIIDTGEMCDSMNMFTASCDPDCTAAMCGDLVVNAAAAEQCDDGNTSTSDACILCRNARCGDGYVRVGVEQCDDGNTSNLDACINTCRTNVCGDGYLWVGVEQCDDGNTVAGDGCNATCSGP